MSKNKKPAVKKTLKATLLLENRPFLVKVPSELNSAQRDLDWFFRQGESDCGVKSNFDALIRALKFSTSHQDETAEDQLINSIDKQRSFQSIMDGTHRYRRVLSSYQKISKTAKVILENFYYEKQFDTSVELFFGAGISLIPMTNTFKKLESKINTLDDLKNFILHDRRRMNKIKTEITTLYFSAVKEYSETQV